MFFSDKTISAEWLKYKRTRSPDRDAVEAVAQIPDRALATRGGGAAKLLTSATSMKFQWLLDESLWEGFLIRVCRPQFDSVSAPTFAAALRLSGARRA